MNKLILLVTSLLLITASYSAESKYEDIPSVITTDMQEFQKLSLEYEALSKSLLPRFNEELNKREGSTFYITNRIYQGDFYEQVFTKVYIFKDGLYRGTIASQPLGKVDFNFGDEIEVKLEDVYDWTIVDAEGNEEGNFLGKFADLYRTGVMTFFHRLTPSQGKYTKIEFMLVANPETKQFITEIIPSQKIEEITAKIESLYLNTDATSEEPYLAHHFVKYPSWEFVGTEANLNVDKAASTSKEIDNQSVDDQGTALSNSMRLGQALTLAVQQKKSIRLKKLPEYREIKAFLKQNKCPGFTYRAYKVTLENDKNFYLVASKGKSIIIGRHFKAPIVNDEIDVSKIERSTNSCLNLGVAPKDAVGMMASHLQAYPNEFHVLQSNINEIDLYVGAKSGQFKISEGQISRLED